MLLVILCIWHSNEPWKSALLMKDPNYLPVPPIFAIIFPKRSKHYTTPILYDLLSVRKSSNQRIFFNNEENLTLYKNFSANRILKQLNRKVNPQKSKKELLNYCINENISQACLILGRIYEFGAYNETENLNLSYFYYNRVLQLNDSTSNSPLAFFHRHIYPNIPLSIVQDDFSPYSIESILTKSIQYENGFLRPISCQKVARDLIRVSEILINMYFQQPGLYLAGRNYTNYKKIMKKENSSMNKKNLKSDENNDPWSQLQKAIYYLTRPYPSLKEIRKARSFLRDAIDKKCNEALPFFLKLEIYIPRKIINSKSKENVKNDKNSENTNQNNNEINNNQNSDNQNSNNENSDNQNSNNENKNQNSNNQNSDNQNSNNQNSDNQNSNNENKNQNSNNQNSNNQNSNNENIKQNNKNENNNEININHQNKNNDKSIIINHKHKISDTSNSNSNSKTHTQDIYDTIFENHILFDQNHPLHPSELISMIEPLMEKGDPESLLLASSHHMRSSVAVAFKPHLSSSIIHSISESEYPPAIHRLAELTYYGLMQIKRSAKDAFILYLKAAACGYNPSILAASKQLVGGDGVCENCEMAVSLLRGIIDSGPWSDFYDKYVKLKRSKIAFLKMIEMGLTPPIWIDQNEVGNLSGNFEFDLIVQVNQNNKEWKKSNVDDFDRFVNWSIISEYEDLLQKFPPFSSFVTKKIFEINPIPQNFQNDQFLQKIRLARKGDAHSLIWLIQHSNISDSLRWLERLESLPIDSFYISHLLRFYIIVKGVLNYRNLDEFDRLLLKMMIAPIFNDFLIFVVTFLLMLFISMRIYYIIS